MKNQIKRFSKDFLTIIIIVVFIFTLSCSDDREDLGTYYENSFQDQIALVTQEDTVNIILTQFKNYFKIKEDIPYSVKDNSSLIDSIYIKLFVSFGSYSKQPVIYKDIVNVNDSFFVYYSSVVKNSKVLSKENGVNNISTSPRISYISVDSVEIIKPQLKVISFSSRLGN